MTTTAEAAQIKAEAAALPALPRVFAQDMLYAQGWTPTAEERAAISARVAFAAKWIDAEHSQVTVPVIDRDGIRIGGLTFTS